jgi:hypothetical protein
MYQPRIKKIEQASQYLLDNGKTRAAELSLGIGVGIRTAGDLLRHLHQTGKAWRDGKSYRPASPDADRIARSVGGDHRIYRNRVRKLIDLVDGEIKLRGKHNRHLARDYTLGRVYSWIADRKETDVLKEVLVVLRQLEVAIDYPMLLVAEQWLSLEMPDWAGRVYRRSEEEEADLAADRREVAAAKPKRKFDPAAKAARQAARDAYLAKKKAAAEEAARQEAEAIRLLTEQIAAADPQDAAVIAAVIAARTASVKDITQVVGHTIPPAGHPDGPVIPEDVDLLQDNPWL